MTFFIQVRKRQQPFWTANKRTQAKSHTSTYNGRNSSRDYATWDGNTSESSTRWKYPSRGSRATVLFDNPAALRSLQADVSKVQHVAEPRRSRRLHQ